MATKIGQVAQELARTNPWWRDEGWASKDPDLRKVLDTDLGYRSNCLDGLVDGGLYLLRGPRRVGKTVTVKQTIETLIQRGVTPQAIVRIAADAWSANDLRTVVQNAALPRLPDGHRRWWLFDEITATSGDWAAQIKWLRDNDPEFSQATVVLTGSNASGLTAAAGTLAGRRGSIDNADRTLLPVGFRTFAKLLDPTLPDVPRLDLSSLRSEKARAAYDELLPWLDVLVTTWEKYTTYGGFPIAVAAARAGKPIPQWFVDDILNVVYRDAFAESRLSETSTSALVERLMESMAAPANMTKIGGDLGLSQNVVARHVCYLRDSYLLWSCPQKSGNSWSERKIAHDKLYAIDPLIARLAYLRNSARADIDLTVLTEMQIGMAVHRAAYHDGLRWAGDSFLFYVRTPARKEIDFVSELLAGTALEGKYVEGGSWAGEAATVNASQYSGILATRNVLQYPADDSAWAIPAAILCYLIDT
jgi:predicted AAA+ superfamily ATPase